MLDPVLRPFLDRSLDRPAAMLAGLGISANAVTLAGLALGLAGAVALAGGAYGTALALILANRLADGLDGAIARTRGPSDLGGYLDIVADFVFYAAVAFGFAVGRPEDALAAAFLLFSFMGTGSSFLAFAVVAAKRGLVTEARGRKSFYYLGGLTEGTETLALFVLICVVPGWFAVAAWVFGTLCWITTLGRVATAVRAFRSAPATPPLPRLPQHRRRVVRRT